MSYKDQAAYINRRYEYYAKPKLKPILDYLEEAQKILQQNKASQLTKLIKKIDTEITVVKGKQTKINDLKYLIGHLAEEKDNLKAN